MPTKRDPRILPKPGDVLANKGQVRKVLSVDGKLFGLPTGTRAKQPYVSWGSIESSIESVGGVKGQPWLSQWRRWAKEATVIYAAD